MIQFGQIPAPAIRAILKHAMAVLALGLAGMSQATIVNVGGAITGCVSSSECGGQHPPPGTHISVNLINPAQLTLGPGTYTITNGSGQAGADPQFTAWNYNTGGLGKDATFNWIWAFIMIDDATRNVLVEGCCSSVYNSQADAATSAFAQNYSATFTLAGTTTLDFITEDYIPQDNAGGVALSILSADAPPTNGVPEPDTTSLVVAGLGLAGWVGRRRKQQR